MFVVGRDAKANMSYEVTSRFLPLLVLVQQQLNCEVIVKHEHRSLFSSNKLILHILFYPSYEHLRNWELPSFCAYIYDRGQFLLGDKNKLNQVYIQYRSRNLSTISDPMSYGWIKHCDLVVTDLIYLTTNLKLFKKERYSKNLLYTLRFILTELFISELRKNDPISFWNWDELFSYMKKRNPNNRAFSDFLEKYKNKEIDLSLDQIKEMLFQCLRLADEGLLTIPKINSIE